MYEQLTDILAIILLVVAILFSSLVFVWLGLHVYEDILKFLRRNKGGDSDA